MSVNIKVTGGLNIEWGQIDSKVTGGLTGHSLLWSPGGRKELDEAVSQRKWPETL